MAFASTSAYRGRPCYAGIAEFSVYVARNRRGAGAGRVAMTALLEAAAAAGFWKVLSRIFPENTASRALMAKLGFREVGIYRAARQARRRLAGLRDRRAPARRSGRMTVRRSVVVSTLGITQTLAWGSTYYLAAVFADPISEALQLPQVWFFGIFSAALLLSGLLGPLAGRMIDKHGGRDVLAATNHRFRRRARLPVVRVGHWRPGARLGAHRHRHGLRPL